jgi:UMF1 family MFS transporter
VDRLGRRKPWVIGAVLVMAPACCALWYAMPGGMTGLPIWAIVCLIVILMVAFESGAVAHNAMLPSIASDGELGRVSGLGLASGAVGSVTAQALVLFAIVLPASDAITWTFLPERPLLGLDPATFEHARIVGPIAGVWMLLFVVPFALWTSDTKGTGVPMVRAIRDGLRRLIETVRHARQMSNLSVFLVARMLYNDGMIAIQAYCGIYAAGVFGWSLATIMVFALILSVACVFGGIVGGRLDARFGSRRAILISLTSSAVAVFVAISVTPKQIFFVPYDAAAAGPVWAFPYFRTLPEIIYVTMYIVLAVTITAIIANSRALMARIAPLSMMSQFFGLYALSGTATAFLGHAMVATFTALFHSQRAGFASLLILLAAGLVLVGKVREERAAELA